MTRKLFWAFWLALPLAVLLWHFGPGRTWLQRDRAGDHLRAAAKAGLAGNWPWTATAYAQARQAWPAEALAEQRRIALAEAVAQMQSGDVIGGQEALESMLTDLDNDPSADPELAAAARHELATSSYYAAWIMRLEGATADEWKPEVERARQQFRLLAERADANSSVADPTEELAGLASRNLEAAIRLEQMDLETLMARPLPKNCCSNCKGLCQKKRKQCASRCQGKKEGKKPGEQPDNDLRKEMKKINSAGLFSGELEGS